MFEKTQTGGGKMDDKEVSVAEKKEADEMKKGGKVRRKSGGHVPGMKSMGRPDKRARGGGCDAHPLSSAGNMSEASYTSGSRPAEDTGGKGADRNAKGFG